MHQLVRAGIVKEIALDNRERIFICEQSARLIAGFVSDLEKMSLAAVDLEL